MTTSRSSASEGSLDDAVRAALRLLAARPRSTQGIDAALLRRGISASVRRRVVRQLTQWGYLDDARFAREKAELLWSQGRWGLAAVRRKLEECGLSPAVVEQALAPLATGADEVAVAREVLARRTLASPVDPTRWRRAERLLASRGFSEETRREVLGEAPLDPRAEGE